MKNKKILIILIFTLIIILIALFFIIRNFEIKQTMTLYNDYTPEEEISSKQYRETIVTLYYIDSNTNSLKSEGKLVDSVTLIENPYKSIIQFLLESPSTENLKSAFPENTSLIDANIQNSCVYLNFSNEILNFTSEDEKYNIINCILNTITQLNEVDSFKILIDGNESDVFPDKY